MRWNAGGHFRLATLIAGISAVISGPSFADGYADTVQIRLAAIKELVAQSKEVCDGIPLSGYKNEIERKIEAQVKLGNIISKITDIGASGAIRTDRTDFENVSQEKLAELLKDRGTCKANFVTTMSASMLAPPSPSGSSAADAVKPKS